MAIGGIGPVGPLGALGPSDSTSNTGPVGPAGPASKSSPAIFPDGTTGTATKTKFNTSGWYLFGGITVSILLGSTPVGPIAFGVLSLALLYQTSLLLQGK